MNNKLSVATKAEILRLRTVLGQISSSSFAFSSLNRSYPLETLSEEDGKAVIDSYKKIIQDTARAIENTQKEARQ